MALETGVPLPDPYSRMSDAMIKDLLLKFEASENRWPWMGIQDHDHCYNDSDYLFSLKAKQEYSTSTAISYPQFRQIIHTNQCRPAIRFPITEAGFDEGRPQKRKRTPTVKNKQEIENQRVSHIAVERNRRRQMNDYFSMIRSLMPPSYAQKGDQASIVGGAIVFLKQLEKHLQSLETQKRKQSQIDGTTNLFSDFFAFPQYTMFSRAQGHYSVGRPESPQATGDAASIGDLEVTLVEGHATVKLLTIRTPKQLLKMLHGFHTLGFNVLHINLTRSGDLVLYTFSLKSQNEREMNTADDIATTVHEMVRRIRTASDFI